MAVPRGVATTAPRMLSNAVPSGAESAAGRAASAALLKLIVTLTVRVECPPTRTWLGLNEKSRPSSAPTNPAERSYVIDRLPVFVSWISLVS